MSRYRVWPTRICWATARGRVSSAQSTPVWNRREKRISIGRNNQNLTLTLIWNFRVRCVSRSGAILAQSEFRRAGKSAGASRCLPQLELPGAAGRLAQAELAAMRLSCRREVGRLPFGPDERRGYLAAFASFA